MVALCLALALLAAVSPTPSSPEGPAGQRAADLAPPVQLTAGGVPIEVGGFAAPFIGDFDGDGKNDLLVGQYALGRLRVYRNHRSNTRPEFDSFQWFTAGGRIAGVPVCCQVAFTPQLVDFDGDGRTDVLTGSGVAGEVFLFRRNAQGAFDDAKVLQNADGEVRMHRCSGRHPRRYNVTALAYDWDDDGDADLLMGLQPLCLVLNQGTAGEPSYDGGRPIECNGEPIPGGLGLPQMADWDGDGLDDLVTGVRRSIVWYRNVGRPGRPEFQSPRLLVPSITQYPTSDVPDDRPGLHHAVCVADFNADGRLDLLVGDRFARAVEISQQERDRILASEDRQEALLEKYNDLRDEPKEETRAERVERYRKLLRTWQEYEALRLAGSTTSNTRYERLGRVWLFPRTAP